MKIPTVAKDAPHHNSSNGGQVRQLSQEQQQQQQHQDAVYGAINAVCETPEQSYSQFVNNFIHLTPEDVSRAKVPTLHPRLPPHLRIPVLQPGGESAQHPDLEHTRDNKAEIPPQSQSNELEEEVLGEGSKAPDILLRRGGSVKVDNFVELEGDDDDDDDVPEEEGVWIDIGGYSASFQSSNPSEDKESRNKPSIIDKSQLTSSQAISNVSAPEDVMARISAKPDGVEENLLDILGDGADDSAQGADKNETDSSDNEEFEPDCYPEQSDNLAKPTPTNNREEEEELKYEPALDLPNPGEVVDECLGGQDSGTDVMTSNVTQLDFRVKAGEPAQEGCRKNTNPALNGAAVATGGDAVEAFSLDEGFDYDNVVLTPKFSATEMAALHAAMSQAKTAD